MKAYKAEPKFAFVLKNEHQPVFIIATFNYEREAIKFAANYFWAENSLECGYDIVPYENLEFD